MGDSFHKTRVVPAKAGTQRRSSKDTGFPPLSRGLKAAGTTILRIPASRTFVMCLDANSFARIGQR
jgi:hypothetical protein